MVAGLQRDDRGLERWKAVRKGRLADHRGEKNSVNAAGNLIETVSTLNGASKAYKPSST